MVTKTERPASKLEAVKGEIQDLKLEDSENHDGASQLVDHDDPVDSEYDSRDHTTSAPANEILAKADPTSASTGTLEQDEGNSQGIIGGEITVKTEPGKPPKLSRAPSQKVIPKAPQLFGHHGDKTDEATGTFEVISACNYLSKYIGYTDLSMDCECTEEWGKGSTHL